MGSLPTQGPNGWPMAERAHKDFDMLTQVQPKNRTREDHIQIDVLKNLETEVEKCKNIKKYVDKFIAHAAAPETRKGLSDEEKNLTLERLKKCHQIIYRVTSFISGQLLWESGLGGLPIPQYDHLVNLDKQWASQRTLKKARKYGQIFKKRFLDGRHLNFGHLASRLIGESRYN